MPNPTARPAHGTLSARIDGVPWSATCVTVNTGALGIVGLGGSDNLPTPTGFGFGFGPSNKVGSYPVSNKSLGINALLTIGPAAWQSAAVSGGTGTLTFTQSTPSNVVGTFAFTLNPTTIVPIPGNTATGTHTVTDGVFNITF